MAGPVDVKVILQLTCTKCGGKGYYDDEQGELCNCPRCVEGQQLIALPLSLVLSHCRPEMSPADSYEAIANLARAQTGNKHPALGHIPDCIPEKVFAERRKSSLHLRREGT